MASLPSAVPGSCDWIEDLFPPAFSFQDMNELQTPMTEMHAKLDKLLSRINRENTGAIRDVYLRALAMLEAERQMKKPKTTIQRPYIKEHVACQTDIKMAPEADVLSEELSHHVLWEGNDLTTLRRNYQKEHEEFLSMRAELRLLRSDLSNQLRQYKQTQSHVEQLTLEASDKDTQITRLNILNSNMKSQLKKLNSKLRDLEGDNSEQVERNKKQDVKLRSLQAQLSDSKLQCQMTIQRLDKIGGEVRLDAEREKAEMELNYQSEINDLIGRINNLTESLDHEQALHNKCKLGLEHLQKHYSHSSEVFKTSKYQPSV